MAQKKRKNPVSLTQAFGISPAQAKDYKLHAAVSDSKDLTLDPPLLALRKGGYVWRKWNRNAPKHDYNRLYIFSMAQIPYMEDKWIFGGVFKVIGKPDKLRNWERPTQNPDKPIYKDRYLYRVRLVPRWANLIGKAEIEFKKPHHAQIRFDLDKQIHRMWLVHTHSKIY